MCANVSDKCRKGKEIHRGEENETNESYTFCSSCRFVA